MSAVVDFVKYVYNAPQEFKPTSARKLLDAYPDYPVYAVVLYLVTIFYLPGFLKKHNLVFNLKYLNAAWNFMFAALSGAGTYHLVSLSSEMFARTHGWHNSVCVAMPIGAPAPASAIVPATTLNENLYFDPTTIHKPGSLLSDRLVPSMDTMYPGPRAFYVALFMYLKTPELFDTVLLILQGKPFSFLQWYHHISTAIFVWHASYALIPSGIYFATMNYFVHAIMYVYFGLVVLGYRRRVRWFAPVVTLLQVVQMFAGIAIVAYTYMQYHLAPWKRDTLFYAFWKALFATSYYMYQQIASVVTTGLPMAHSKVPAYPMDQRFVGCETDATNLRMAVMMYGTYCVLFVKLFRELYVVKTYNKDSLVVRRRETEGDRATVGEKAAQKSEGIPTGIVENDDEDHAVAQAGRTSNILLSQLNCEALEAARGAVDAVSVQTPSQPPAKSASPSCSELGSSAPEVEVKEFSSDASRASSPSQGYTPTADSQGASHDNKNEDGDEEGAEEEARGWSASEEES